MVGNGQSFSISHTGSLSTLVPQSSLFLSNVLVVPGIKKKLISISQLTKDNNCCVIFSPFGFTIQDRVTRVVLGVDRCENGLYVLDQNHHALVSIVSSNKPCVSVPLWHARLSHPSFRTILSLSKSGFISCSNKLMGLDSSLCVGCNIGKSHRLHFSLNNNRCHLPFDCLHCDLWGPSLVCSLTGFCYYAMFIDDCTRFSCFFPLKHKSNFVDTFINFQHYIETQFSSKIKSFQCDGGTELTNNKFRSHLTSYGIVLCIACPYTPTCH